MKRIIALVAIITLTAGVTYADKFTASGGFRAGSAPGLSQNPGQQAPGDAYTRTKTGAPFVSNPGDAFYDTTIQRNQGYDPTEYRRARPEPGPDRHHPVRGSEVRISR